MDIKLVGRALQCYGIDLVRNLSKEQQEQPSPALLWYLDRPRTFEPEIKDEQFQRNLCAFIGRKSDLLFKSLSQEEKDNRKKEESIDDSFAIMPALEIFLNIPSHQRRDHFFQSLRNDDCVTGVVTSILENGLRVKLLCVDKGKARDIEDLDIMAFCPAKELPKLYAKESALDAFQEKDIVRGIILSVSADAQRIIMSLHEKAIPDKQTYPRIGLITEDEFPVYFRRKSQIQGMCYEEMMHSILGFNNTGNVKALLSQLGIEETNSHLRCHARLRIPEKEYAEGLKKWQSAKLAHQSVTTGVEVFKEGKYLEAMQHFSRALQIDPQNVEALVARGALIFANVNPKGMPFYSYNWNINEADRIVVRWHANKENYNNAIQDFEEALSVNPEHNNARNYLIETLMAVGRMCEEKRDFEEACARFVHILELDPNREEAKEMLSGCRHLMAIQDSQESPTKKSKKIKRMDSRTSDSEEEKETREAKTSSPSFISKTTAKLKQLIKEDAQGSGKKKKRRKRSSRSSSTERERKKKKKKRRRSSSSSSSSSSSGSSSGGRGRKRQSSKKSSKRKISGGSAEKVHDTWKEKSSPEKKDFKARNKSPESMRRDNEDEFARKIESAAASSFMPVSSFEFFNKSTTIPGLGSPPSGDPSFEPALAPKKDLIVEREKSVENEQSVRRNSYLMAEREKFYNDNRDRYQTFGRRSRARSGSSSTSSSGSRGKRARHTRSRSKSPIITGVKELDMYLGGAKKLIARTQEGSKYDTWESFIAKSAQDSKGGGPGMVGSRSISASRRSRSKSSSRRQRSRSKSSSGKRRSFSRSPERQERSRSKSSSSRKQRRDKAHGSPESREKRQGKSPSSESLSRSDFKDKERSGTSEKFSSASSTKALLARMNSSQSLQERDKDYSNLEKGEEDTVSKFKSRWDKGQNKKEDNKHLQEHPKIHRRDEAEKYKEMSHRREKRDDIPKMDRSLSRELSVEQGSSMSRLGPGHKQQVEKDNVVKKEGMDKIKEERYLLAESSRKEHFKPMKGELPTMVKKEEPFMPRVLRKPKMDDPSINRPLFSSNELATREREKRKIQFEKEQQRLSASEGNSTRSVASGLDRSDSEKVQASGSLSKISVDVDRLEKHRNNSKDSSIGNEKCNEKKQEDGVSDGAASRRHEGTRTDYKKGEFMGEKEKQYSEQEIEQEIERRVQQRLQEEESRLKREKEEILNQKLQALAEGDQLPVTLENPTENVNRSRWDMKERKTKESRTKDETKGIFEDVDGGNEMGGPTVKELNDGWTYDIHGNKYFAIQGTVVEAGWNKDSKGNPYYISEDEGFDSMQLARAANKGMKTKAADRKGTKLSGRRSSKSYTYRDGEREDGKSRRDLQERSRFYERGRSRDRAFRGGFQSNVRNSVSDWKSHGRYSKSRSKSQSRSKSGERRSRDRGSRSKSGERRSRDRGSKPRRMPSKSRGERTRSGDRHKHSHSISHSPSTSEVTFHSQAQEMEADTTSSTEKVSNKSDLPPSKWDTVGSSRWESKQGMSSMKTEGRAGSSKVDRVRKESLTELEKFLIDLKQQKKKQWIAEGKVKEKD